MKGWTKAIWNHGILLVSAFLMLVAVTLSWFINNRTTNVTPMSFASVSSGGATLYKTLEVGGVTHRAVDTVDGVLSITNTAHWKDQAESPDQSDVTVENMLPGQCAYFFILANGPTDVTLTNITLIRGDGTVPDLADCLGLYLLPVEGATEVPTESQVTTSLVRLADLPPGKNVPPLVAAHLLGTPTDGFTLPTTVESNAYILALVCDPLYGQDGTTNTLAGSVSFSLGFDADTVS